MAFLLALPLLEMAIAGTIGGTVGAGVVKLVNWFKSDK